MARQYGHNTESADKVRAELILEQEENDVKKRKLERIATFSFVILGVILLVFNVISANDYKTRLAQTQIDLQSAQDKLTELQKAVENAPKQIITQEVAHASAKEAGEYVCKGQNDLNKATKSESELGMDSLSAEHQDALNRVRMYISKNSNNSGLARNTWCLYGIWEFDSVYDFEGTKCDVVWKCYHPDDTHKERLLAFTTASFDATTGMFSNVTVMKTTWYDTYAETNGAIVTEDEGNSYTGGTDPIYDENGNIIQEGSDEIPTDESVDKNNTPVGVTGNQGRFDNGDAYNCSSNSSSESTGGTN